MPWREHPECSHRAQSSDARRAGSRSRLDALPEGRADLAGARSVGPGNRKSGTDFAGLSWGSGRGPGFQVAQFSLSNQTLMRRVDRNVPQSGLANNPSRHIRSGPASRSDRWAPRSCEAGSTAASRSDGDGDKLRLLTHADVRSGDQSGQMLLSASTASAAMRSHNHAPAAPRHRSVPDINLSGCD